MTQATPSTAITASVAQQVTIVVIWAAVLLAPSVVRPGAAPLVIHGFVRKIIGVMSVMMTQA
ncbi:MAG: hypothetical protein A2Y65_00335 [Deltaproteobacteria bacterium RBG_13_52_11]|nr:MAG: hypothetical protein A2Y65_00335 [Deltaproteobacteria bacterium RBG_13_52_11]